MLNEKQKELFYRMLRASAFHHPVNFTFKDTHTYKEIRMVAGLTQQDMATLLNVSRRYLNEFENHKLTSLYLENAYLIIEYILTDEPMETGEIPEGALINLIDEKDYWLWLQKTATKWKSESDQDHFPWESEVEHAER